MTVGLLNDLGYFPRVDDAFVCDVPAYAHELTSVLKVKLKMSICDYFANCETAPFVMCRCRFETQKCKPKPKQN